MIFGTQVYKIETKAKFKSVTLNQMLSELLHFVIFILIYRVRKVALSIMQNVAGLFNGPKTND